jgi:hypothetical protein
MTLKNRYLALATACREVASECLKPNTAPFGIGYTFKDGSACCAIGHVVARAGYILEESVSVTAALTFYLGEVPSDSIKHEFQLVGYYNDREYPVNRNGVVAGKLRALADSLDRVAINK